MTDKFLRRLGWDHGIGPVFVDKSGDLIDRTEFRSDVLKLSAYLEKRTRSVVLYTGSPYHFTCVLFAALLRGMDLYLPGMVGNSQNPDGSLPPEALYLGDGNDGIWNDLSGILNSLSESPAEGPEICTGANPRVFLLTSGSTGEPKSILKTPAQLDAEISVLNGLWGDHMMDAVVVSTVSHQHLYGLLFAILLPLTSGGLIFCEKIEHPESLGTLPGKRRYLVSSPAFLSRIAGVRSEGTMEYERVFSSGGPLAAADAATAESVYSCGVIEIFGSTETGGIAYRRVAEDDSWKPFDGIALSPGEDGRLMIVSNYLESREPFLSQDLAEFREDGNFRLLGRSDSVVKIEEKRVSLNEMAGCLRGVEWVEDARLTVVTGSRQNLAAIVVPGEQGLSRLYHRQRKVMISELKTVLESRYPAILIPRRWRFMAEFPRNDMSKIRKSDLEAISGRKIRGTDYEVLRYDSEKQKLTALLSFPERAPVF